MKSMVIIQFSSAQALLGADWSVCDQSEVHQTHGNGGPIVFNGGFTKPNQCFCRSVNVRGQGVVTTPVNAC